MKILEILTNLYQEILWDSFLSPKDLQFYYIPTIWRKRVSTFISLDDRDISQVNGQFSV